jgi:hypothetical protein
VITTVHLALSWPGGIAPRLSENPVQHLAIKDPRVLLGVQQVLARRMGVTQPPDLVRGHPGPPFFAVSLNDTPEGGMFSERMAVTTLLAYLTEPVRFSVAFAADGGWKTLLADVNLEVI